MYLEKIYGDIVTAKNELVKNLRSARERSGRTQRELDEYVRKLATIGTRVVKCVVYERNSHKINATTAIELITLFCLNKETAFPKALVWLEVTKNFKSFVLRMNAENETWSENGVGPRGPFKTLKDKAIVTLYGILLGELG